MNVRAGKRVEMLQTMTALSGSLRMDKGCHRCDFCHGIEDENLFFFLEEWDVRENLMTHLESEHFRVLHGAMHLLEKPYEITFHTVFRSAGMREGGEW